MKSPKYIKLNTKFTICKKKRERDENLVVVEVMTMDERRRGVWSCRRIVATKGESSNNGSKPNIKINNKNIIKKLQTREISPKPHRSFVAATSPHRFQNMRLTHQFDTHDPKHHSSPSPFLPFLMKRTKVVEIVAAKNIVFALAHSGLCAAFSRGSILLKYYVMFFFLLHKLQIIGYFYA